MENKLTSLEEKTDVMEDTFTAAGVEVLGYSILRPVLAKCDTHVLIELTNVEDGWEEDFKIGLTLLDGDGKPIFVGKRPAARAGFYNAYDIAFFIGDAIFAATARAKLFAAEP